MGVFTKDIARVKVLGVRTAHETKVFATYNFGIYCLLIQYMDGSLELKEVDGNGGKMNKYLPYIEWPYPSD